MVQVIPKWRVNWTYEDGSNNSFIINAKDQHECMKWFSYVNHGLSPVVFFTFTRLNDSLQNYENPI